MSRWKGKYTNHNPGFTEADKIINATIIASYLKTVGYNMAALCGVIGNMEWESYLNPGQWQLGSTIEQWPPAGVGFGLVQWTPWTKFSDWAGSDWRTNYTKQLERLEFERANGLQWITLSSGQFAGITFNGFLDFEGSPALAARCWCEAYERGTWAAQRSTYAENWYTYFRANPIPDWTPPGSLSANIPIWLLFKIRENNEKKVK